MKIRAHRELLADAMETVGEIEPTKEAVWRYLAWEKIDVGADEVVLFMNTYSPNDIEVKPYGYDSRIEWNTHIVTLNGDAVAFTDGPLKE